MKLYITFSAALLLALSSSCWAEHGFLHNMFGNNIVNRSISLGTKDCQGPLCFLDSSALDAVDDKMEYISFDLHGGARSIRCNMDELGSDLDNKYWAGNCDGNGFVNLLSQGTNSKGEKLLFGSITDMETQEICRFTPDADGNNQVDCIPAADYPIEIEPRVSTPPEEDDPTDVDGDYDLPLDLEPDSLSPVTYGLKGSAAAAASRQDSNNETRRILQDDNGGVLDIMIAYTRQAECLNAGRSRTCSTSSTTRNLMRGQLNAAVAETNRAFANSGVQTRLRLVHSYRENYSEGNGRRGVDDALVAVRKTDDRMMDGVHSRRNQYGADIVALIIGMEDPQGTYSREICFLMIPVVLIPPIHFSAGYCGMGWSGPRRDLMFSVTDYRCLTGNMAFAHEVGHNLVSSL